MNTLQIANIVGAISLAVSVAVLFSTQGEALEAGPAAAALTMVGHVPGVTVERWRRLSRAEAMRDGPVRCCVAGRLLSIGFSKWS